MKDETATTPPAAAPPRRAEHENFRHQWEADPTAYRGVPAICAHCRLSSFGRGPDEDCTALLRLALDRAREGEERLKDVLHIDRSGLAAALEEVWRTAGGYAWVAEGRGPYEWDDEEYRAEMGRMVRAICSIASKAIEASGDLAHAECCGRKSATQGGLVAVTRENLRCTGG